MCMVEFRVDGKKIQLAGVYRSPSTNQSDRSNFCKEAVGRILNRFDRSAECFFMGDLNICLLNPDPVVDEYTEEIARFGFILLHDSMLTRVTETTSSLIDHVMHRNVVGSNHLLNTLDSKGVSDHYLIDIKFFLDTVCHERSAPLVYKRIDYDLLRSKDWSAAEDAASPTEALRILQEACVRLTTESSSQLMVRRRFAPIKP